MLRWIDTHNHLFVFPEKKAEQEVKSAEIVGLVSSLICAGGPENFEAARNCAYALNQGYAVGIHPLFIRGNWQADLEQLSLYLETHSKEDRLVALGECGLDFTQESTAAPEVQEKVFCEQLKLARRFDLPLSLHGRGAIDIVLKHIRRLAPQKGVLHAFNGSFDQARAFQQNGFKLGYGGAMAYEGSKRIRKVFAALPNDAWVLETDSPDMPAPWRRESCPNHPESMPEDIVRYAQIAAALRGCTLEEISEQGIVNTVEVFPKFKDLIA